MLAIVLLTVMVIQWMQQYTVTEYPVVGVQ